MSRMLIVFFVFISVWWISINTTKLIRGEAIPFWNFIIMSVGVTGIITHFIGVW